jgi:fucose permease
MKVVLNKYRGRLGVILLAYIAFISLGLPDGLLGVAWPSIRASFGLPLDSLGMLLVATTAGYLTSSFSSGRLIARLGVGRVLAASCAATGLGLIGYALVPEWGMMVALGVVAGLGAGAIDAGLNTYVAAHFGAGLMQWLHASYGIGVALGPIIMTVAITVFDNWRLGYAVVGTAQLGLAACFVLTLSMWQSTDEPAQAKQPKRMMDYKTSMAETLRRPMVWLSLLMFFLYTGAEVTLGTWTYSLLTESRGIAPHVAGLWASSYWIMFTIGRIIAGLYAGRIGVHTLVRVCLLSALGGAVLLWWNPVQIATVLGVVIVGFAIAPIFPGMVSGTNDRVGARYAANTIGMQIGAAGLGAALIAGLAGVLAQHTSLEAIPMCLVIMFAALFGLYSLSMKPRKAQMTPVLDADAA